MQNIRFKYMRVTLQLPGGACVHYEPKHRARGEKCGFSGELRGGSQDGSYRGPRFVVVAPYGTHAHSETCLQTTVDRL